MNTALKSKKFATGRGRSRAETFERDSTWDCPVEPVTLAVLLLCFVVVHVAVEAEQTEVIKLVSVARSVWLVWLRRVWLNFNHCQTRAQALSSSKRASSYLNPPKK